MERLKQLRSERSLYQKDIANYLGIDRTTYVKYENGTSEPNNDMLLKLAEFFNVSTDYLLEKTNKKDTDKNIIPSDDDIKFALFNGDKEITDDMYEEVKRFAQFVKDKKQSNTDKNKR
jgi:transcriptional regulator with XRE-family HTH domain